MKKLFYIFLAFTIFFGGCSDYKDLESQYDIFNFLGPVAPGQKTKIIITQPNGGTIKGLPFEIKWTADTISIFKLDIYLVIDTVEYKIASNIKASSFSFTCDNLPYFNYTEKFTFKIRIKDASNEKIFSDSKEIIYEGQTPNIFISIPGKDYEINSGSRQQVVWRYLKVKDEKGFVDLYYKFINDNQWTYITTHPLKYATYYWTVPDVYKKTECQLKIVETYNQSNYSITPKFTILPTNYYLFLSPISSSIFYIGQSYVLSWRSSKSDYVNIYYSTDDGVKWNYIDRIYSEKTLDEFKSINYTWTVPNIEIDSSINNCRIKIQSVSDTNHYSISEKFKISKLDQIKILSPKKDENLYINQKYTIKWEHQKAEVFKLYISSDNGNTWSIISDYTRNKEYEFTPNESYKTGFYRIKVEDYYGQYPPGISDPFKIIASSIQIDYPLEGYAIIAKTPIDIKWRATNVNYLKCDYSLDYGFTWINIFDNQIATNTAGYPWTLPDTVVDNCKLRIMDKENTFVQSEVSFPIVRPQVTFYAPANNTLWYGGTQRTIQWTSKVITKANLYYSTDGGNEWVTIATNVASPDVTYPTLNTYLWVIPVLPQTYTNCRIKIEKSTNRSYYFISPPFIIQKP